MICLDLGIWEQSCLMVGIKSNETINKIQKQINLQTININVQYQLRNQVRNQVDNQVSNPVSNQVRNQMRNQI